MYKFYNNIKRDENNKIIDEDLKLLKDKDIIIQTLTDFLNLFDFISEQRVLEYKSLLLEVGWNENDIAYFENLACKKTNWTKNSYIRNMTEHLGKSYAKMGIK